MVKNIDILGVNDDDVIALFNNIEEIRDFNEYDIVCIRMCKCVCVFVYASTYALVYRNSGKIHLSKFSIQNYSA